MERAEIDMYYGNSENIISVSELNEYVKMLLDSDEVLSHVCVRGEISNFTNHFRTGHFYFSLKDSGGLVRAVMFSSRASSVKFVPENGMKVIARGRVSSFVRDGQYQLYVDDMQPDGIGALYLAFEQLKKKLGAEGLFDEARKKPLPKFPKRVGIITSATGAALRDMLNVSKRRFPSANIVIFPSLVQGAEAPLHLCTGIEFFEATGLVDVIIIGRGGGSLEDLYAFNDEMLARRIADCPIPVVSAVGHETDFTICDFVADMRAPTPSAAAELVFPDSEAILGRIDELAKRARLNVLAGIDARKKKIDALLSSRALSSPKNYIEDKRMALAYLTDKLDTLAQKGVSDKRKSYAALVGKLEALSPLSVLSRGYAIVTHTDEDGAHSIMSVSDVKEDDVFRVRLGDGQIESKVINVIPE